MNLKGLKEIVNAPELTDEVAAKLGRRLASIKVARIRGVPPGDSGRLALLLGGSVRQLVLLPGELAGRACTFVCGSPEVFMDGMPDGSVKLFPICVMLNDALAPLARGAEGEPIRNADGQPVEDRMPGQYL